MKTQNPQRGSQKRLPKFQTLVFVVMIPLLFLGCSGLSPERMAPKSSPSVSKIGGNVRIMDVTGGKKSTFGGMEMIDNDRFKQTLILTLQKSGLFSDIKTDRGDLDLYATIRSQDQKPTRGLQYTATMVASYKFVDSSGKTVWVESYESEYSSTAFSGAARMVEAREGSVRENLVSLLNGIKERWPKNQASLQSNK